MKHLSFFFVFLRSSEITKRITFLIVFFYPLSKRGYFIRDLRERKKKMKKRTLSE